MVISIFKLPEDGKTWAEQKTGDICDCISLEYEKYFNGVGTFTAELPVNTRFRDKLEVNSVLMTDSGDALIVKNIKTTLDKITLTGYDLNGLLCDRLTMTDKEDGYDTQEGASETIIKHFVSANLADCELDTNRNLPRFGVAEDKARGILEDSAMPRLQNVQELVTEICGAAKLGWRVSVNGNAANDKPIFVFDVVEQVDRSADQSERNRVIFSAQMRNVSTMTREVGVTAAKNALFLDVDGTVVQYPQSGDSSGRTVFAGYDRREEYCSLATDSLEEGEYSAEAEQNMADRMNETDSLTIDAGNPLDYGTLYDVGTIVTVYDKARSLQLNSAISAVTVRRSGSEYSVKLTLGESKPKLLDQYQKKSGAVGKTVRNESVKVSTTGTLTEYQYLTDTSVKFNGTTYTVEKDADTGLISKISDSAGNEFEPDISAGITDVATHNAVFWAVAMCRGLTPKEYVGMFSEYIPKGIDISSAVWRDNIGSNDMALVGSPTLSDGVIQLSGNQTYGQVSIDEPLTIYAYFKGIRGGMQWTPVVTKGLTSDTGGAAFDIWLSYGNIAGTGNQTDLVSNAYSTDWHVVCITREENNAQLYIDGSLIGNFSTKKDSLYAGFYRLNSAFRGSVYSDNPGQFTYRYIAFGALPHTADQVKRFTQEIIKKYGG